MRTEEAIGNVSAAFYESFQELLALMVLHTAPRANGVGAKIVCDPNDDTDCRICTCVRVRMYDPCDPPAQVSGPPCVASSLRLSYWVADTLPGCWQLGDVGRLWGRVPGRGRLADHFGSPGPGGRLPQRRDSRATR